MEAKNLEIDPSSKAKKIASPQGLPIKWASLHQAIMIPKNVIGSEKTLDVTKQIGIVMTYTALGLVINFKGSTAIIPLANVSAAVLGE